ncbi:MAG: DUF6671 family protein [Bacteroidota bacterium]
MQNINNYFQNRQMLIATKHEKEKVIAPLLEKELGVKCFVPENFNTDVLGTFTGEVERKDDPITTVRNKCLMAMEKENCDLAIASEGSFGPHPFIFLAYADDEILLFIDKKNNLEIVARELSTETNFNGSEIKSEKQLKDFAKQTMFPSHSLVLTNEKGSHKKIIKGISDWETLTNTYKEIVQTFGSAYAETDMRAMHNPTRMKVIEKATENLVTKIFSQCPQCGTPGFDITEVKRGLLCSLCGSKTRSTLSYIYTCQKCSFTKEEMYPNNKTTEEPTYCDVCNP